MTLLIRGARGDRRSRARLEARGRRHDLRPASQPLPRLQRGVQPVPALPSRRRPQVRGLETVRAHRSALHQAVPRDDEPGLPDRARRQRARWTIAGAAGITKFEYARLLAASLAHLVSRQGDAVGLVTYADAVRQYLPSRGGQAHLRSLLLALEPHRSWRTDRRRGGARPDDRSAEAPRTARSSSPISTTSGPTSSAR